LAIAMLTSVCFDLVLIQIQAVSVTSSDILNGLTDIDGEHGRVSDGAGQEGWDMCMQAIADIKQNTDQHIDEMRQTIVDMQVKHEEAIIIAFMQNMCENTIQHTRPEFESEMLGQVPNTEINVLRQTVTDIIWE
jgi:hypothetical protein